MTPLLEPAPAVAAPVSKIPFLRRAYGATLYSASRLALNLAPNILTLLVVRWMPLDAAHTLLSGFATAIFLTNTASTWLELVIYRYAVADVGRSIRRVLWLESLSAILILLALPSLFGPHAPLAPGIRALLAAIVVADLIYRAGLAALQIDGQDRVWIRLNAWRLFVDIGLTAGVAYATRSGILVLLAMAVCRVGAAIAILQASPLYRPDVPRKRNAENHWLRYGISISLWTSILQVLQYLPQFAAVRLLPPLESTAFLAGFRLFVQSSLLVTGFLLLYLHPKLLGGYRDRGAGHFYSQWTAILPWYGGVTILFAAICALAYPFAAPLILGAKYSESARVVLWTIPGIVSLSLANYVQKLLEVRESVLPMTCYLAISTLSFPALMLTRRAGPEATPLALCIALSFAFTLYLAMIAAHAGLLIPKLPKAVSRRVIFIGTIAVTGTVALPYQLFGR
jgi:hypothetical protein